jgi:UPF0755 protein
MMKRVARNILIGVVAFFVIAVSAVIFIYMAYFSAPEKNAGPEYFILPRGITDKRDITNLLAEEGFIRSRTAFLLVFENLHSDTSVRAGGYELSKSMSVWEILANLTDDTEMEWVTIPEGLRKEEIAEIVKDALGWTEDKKAKWLAYTEGHPDHIEGVYFPETYLIPKNEDVDEVAMRMRNRFQEVFSKYSDEALAQNIKWTTVLKIASLIQREAADGNDMPVIAGVIWNRLDEGMKLDIDATIQYARGDEGDGWWAPISVSDKEIDSPYNTYMYAGLPPTPIANPGESAIQAVLYPEGNDCLFYLHAPDRTIYCSETYDEHLDNIEIYLK